MWRETLSLTASDRTAAERLATSRLSHAGIVVFRLRDQRWKTLEAPLARLIADGGLKSLKNGLAVVDETRIRWKRPKK